MILFTGGGVSAPVHAGIHPLGRQYPRGQTPSPLGRHPPERQHPLYRHPPADGYCCGWYASYWNAFFFISVVVCVCSTFHLHHKNISCSEHIPIGNKLINRVLDPIVRDHYGWQSYWREPYYLWGCGSHKRPCLGCTHVLSHCNSKRQKVSLTYPGFLQIHKIGHIAIWGLPTWKQKGSATKCYLQWGLN